MLPGFRAFKARAFDSIVVGVVVQHGEVVDAGGRNLVV